MVNRLNQMGPAESFIKVESSTLKCKQDSVRSKRGSAIAEFGPALAILLLMFFFPLVDCLALGITYASCMVLNYCQLREAAFCSKAESQSVAGPVKKSIPQTWSEQGLGRFVNVANPVETEVTYMNVSGELVGGVQDQFVQVKTKVVATPFLTIPFFPGVPGLGAPVTLTVAGERLLETSGSTQQGG